MQKYSQFARLLKSALTERRSLKTIIMTSHSDKEFIRQAYGILMKAVQHWDLMEDMITVLETESGFYASDRYLMAVLILELCNPSNTKKKIGGRLSRMIKDNREYLDKMLLKNQVFSESHLRKPVSLRIIPSNLKAQLPQDIISQPDQHVPNLYWTTYSSYSQFTRQCDEQTKSTYIVQSKPSALPAYLLLRCLTDKTKLKFDIIDCCAAPGNKTLQLAEFMKTRNIRGKIFAFEKSSRRYNILQDRIKQYGFQDYVQCILKDFLRINPENLKYKNVRFILLDPSCSGSGMVQQRLVTRQDETIQVADDKRDQVESLAIMQNSLLSLCSRFPNVIRIIYSTCSIYQEENEDVANNFLSTHTKWQPIKLFQEWKSRGLNRDEFVRFYPTEKEDGFFISMFKKTKLNQQ